MIVYKDWEPEPTVVSPLGNLNPARKLAYRGAAGLGVRGRIGVKESRQASTSYRSDGPRERAISDVDRT